MKKIASEELLYRFAPDKDSTAWKRVIQDTEERKAYFAELSETVPTLENLVFFESMSGARVMDSPYAIYQALPRTSGLTYVWSSWREASRPEGMPDREDTLFVRRHTPEYMYFLARAKYVIGNSVLPDYFVRKPDQNYLNTWHGIGYKTLGRHSQNRLGAGLPVTNMLQATHILSPCPFMTETLETGFSLKGTRTAELAEVGLPRVDQTLNMTKDRARQLAQKLRLTPGEPTVLYAPTWRGGDKGEGFDTRRLSKDLAGLMKITPNTIFLGHHLMMRHLADADVGGVILPDSSVNTNEILAISDLLITDYSSIFFDFLVTERPIVHYQYDYEEYEESRGLSLTKEALPGELVESSSGLLQSVAQGLSDPEAFIGDRYRGAKARFTPYDEGASSTAVTKWFFEGDSSEVNLVERSKRPRICYWGGRIDDTPESESFLENLRARVEANDGDVTLFVAWSPSKDSDRLDRLLEEIGERISVVARRAYSFGMTHDEARARQELSRNSLPETRRLYDNIYRREYRRLFGETRFDEVILRPNLTHFWKELSKYAYK